MEVLGWDHVHLTDLDLEDNKQPIRLSPIAQKRGVVVFHVETHRTVLADRHFLRRLALQISKRHHEHIAIYACRRPMKQVWVWFTRLSTGKKIVHREHPFFSDEPPPSFVRRIEGLGVSIDDEERLTLSEVLRKSQQAMDHPAEQNLFSKYPWLARNWDRLAERMRGGDRAAFEEFVASHDRLCIFYAKRIGRWFRIEFEDAMQMARMGLIEAARRYDPEKGYQFSTYACQWLRQRTNRLGKHAFLYIHVPDYLFWPLWYLDREFWRWTTKVGPDRAKDWLYDTLLEREQTSEWSYYKRAINLKRFRDLDREELRQAYRVPDRHPSPAEEYLKTQQRADLRQYTTLLNAREHEIILRRFGFDEPEETLETIGKRIGVTRERVRQLERSALDKLAFLLKDVDIGVSKARIAATLLEIEKRKTRSVQSQGHCRPAQ